MTDNKARNPEQELITAARDELERSVQSLDPITQIRLRAARAQALQAANGHPVPPWWAPAAVTATIVAIAAGALLFQPYAPVDGPADLMSTLDDGYELYENLEFYEWLEEQADENHV